MKRKANKKQITEPKPTHGEGKHFTIRKLGVRKSNGAKVFGEIERGTSYCVQAGAIVPLMSQCSATNAMYFINLFALDKLNFLLSDLDRLTKNEPRNKQDAIYLREMLRGAFRNDLINLRDTFERTDICVGQVMRNDIDARIKREADKHGAHLTPNEGV